MLRKFGRWFSSAPGVWQTALIVLGWYAGESLDLIHDSQHFQLLLWLTVYSGITQPVLAYVNKVATDADEQIFERIEDMERKILEHMDVIE